MDSLGWLKNVSDERFERVRQEEHAKAVESPIKNLCETAPKPALEWPEVGSKWTIPDSNRVYTVAELFRSNNTLHVKTDTGLYTVELIGFHKHYKPLQPAQAQPAIKVGQVWRGEFNGDIAHYIVKGVNGYNIECQKIAVSDVSFSTLALEKVCKPVGYGDIGILATPKPTVNWRPIGEWDSKNTVEHQIFHLWHKVLGYGVGEAGYPNFRVVGPGNDSYWSASSLTHFAEIELPEGPK